MNKKHSDLIKKYGGDAIVKRLDPYLTAKRKKRIAAVLDARLQSIQLAIEHPADINNALAAVRSSEALGISTVHIIAPESNAVYARSITQGAIYWVDVIYYETLAQFLNKINSQKIVLAAGALHATQPLSRMPIDQPLCIMLGNEQRGLSAAAQAACHLTFKIPMYGVSESLNLSVSAAISLYDTTSRKRALLKQDGDLTAQQRSVQQAGYYLNSVDARLIGLFK